MQKVGILIALVGVWLWNMGDLAHAAVMNGDFSAGLAPWTTEDTDTNGILTAPSASIAEMGGEARLATQGLASGIVLISLSQAFNIPPLSTTLSFDVGLTQDNTDAQPAGASFPDFLQVSYVDATDINFYQAFLGLDVNGPYDPTTLDTVLLPQLGNGLFHFTTSIATLAGRSGTLFFDLFDQDDGFFSTARVDNVSISVETTAVPEPGTWLLVVSGMLGLARLGRVCKL